MELNKGYRYVYDIDFRFTPFQLLVKHFAAEFKEATLIGHIVSHGMVPVPYAFFRLPDDRILVVVHHKGQRFFRNGRLSAPTETRDAYYKAEKILSIARFDDYVKGKLFSAHYQYIKD